MKKPFFLSLTVIILGFSIFTSCKKERTNNNEETEAAMELIANDAEATKVHDMIDNQINDYSAAIDSANYANSPKFLDSCVTVTIDHPDTTNWPKTITLTFSGNCTNTNGHILSGQIIIHQTARYRVEGMVRTISFNNFKIDGYIVGGTKTITNEGRVNGFLTYSVVIANDTLSTPTGEVIATRNAQRTRKWIEGENTLNRFDDVYLIEGTTSGSTRNGKNYTSAIISPLRAALNCRWITQGQIRTIVDNGPTVFIDFGDGSCDQYATLTIDGNTRTITLRH